MTKEKTMTVLKEDEKHTIEKVKVIIYDTFNLNEIDPKFVTLGMSECLVNKAYNAGYEIEAFEELCDKMKAEFRKSME